MARPNAGGTHHPGLRQHRPGGKGRPTLTAPFLARVLLSAGPITAIVLLAGWLSLHSPPLDAQTIDRWLFIPYGQPGRLDHEPNERSPNGRTELRFSFEGRPWRSIRRFSQSLARDHSLASSTPDAFDNGRPDPAEINRLLEVFQRAAIEAELTPASLVAPFPGSSGLPAPQASDTALLASATTEPTAIAATAAAIASLPLAPPPAEAPPLPASPPNEGSTPIR